MCTKQKITIAVSILMLLAMLTALFGSMQVDAVVVLKPLTTSWEFEVSGGSKEITVNYNNTWSIKSKPSWITTSGVNTGKLKLSASANQQAYSRSGKVVLESMGDTATINVSQKANYVTVSDSFQLSAAGTQKTLSVSSGLTFTLGTPSQSWLTVKKSGSNVLVSATANSGAKRSATFNINCGTIHKTVTVTQSANYVTPAEKSWESNAAGQTKTIAVSTGTGALTVECDANWITVTENDTSVTITTVPNSFTLPRTARITLRSGNMYGSIDVTQKENYLNVPAEFTLEASADPAEVTIEAGNGSFGVSENISWLEVTKNTGSITLTPKANSDSLNARKGTITITCGEIEKTIPVTQKGNSLEISRNEYNFGVMGGTTEITVKVGSKSEYNVTPDAGWITTAKNGDKLTIKVSANPDGESRKGKITITSCGMFEYFNITQEGCRISLSVENAEFDKETDTISITAEENTFAIIPSTNYSSWSVESDSDWIEVTKDASKVTVKAAPNYFLYARYGAITVSAGNLSITYKVRQEGDSLSLTATSYNPAAAGGKITSGVNVASGRDFTVKCESDWVTVTKNGSGIEVEVAVNRNADVRIATVKVSAGVMSETIDIRQDANTVTLNKNVLTFEGPGGKQYVNASTTSGLPIIVNSNTAWVKTEYNGNVIAISVDPSDVGEERVGTVFVSAGTVSERIEIKQNPHTLELVNVPKYEQDAKANEFEVLVRTNSDTWEVTSDSPKWLRIIRTNNSSFKISLTLNSTGITRFGKVTVDANGKTEVIEIKQSPNEVTCNPTYLVTDKTGKLLSVKIESKYGGWKVKEVSADWLQATKASGTELKVSVSEKNSPGERKANIIIDACGKLLAIPVHQVDVMPAFVTLDKNGYGEIPEDYARWAFIGKTYPENCVPELSDSRKAFLGWYTEREGGVRVDTSTVCTTTENHTLYAHWGEIEVYVYKGEYRSLDNEIIRVHANAMGRVNQVEFYESGGQDVVYTGSYTETAFNDLVIVANVKEELLVGDDSGWFDISCGSMKKEDGWYVYPCSMKIDPFYTNLTESGGQKTEGREGEFTVTVGDQKKTVGVTQYKFSGVNVDDAFYSNRFNRIVAEESEKKAPKTLAAEWLYCSSGASTSNYYGNSQTHTLMSACATADGCSSATFQEIVMSYTVTNDYRKNIPISFQIDSFGGFETDQSDYNLAREYLGLTDVVVNVTVKDRNIRIVDAYAFYTDDATNENISGRRKAISEFIEIMSNIGEKFAPVWPDFGAIATLSWSFDVLQEKIEIYKTLKEAEALGKAIDELDLKIAKQEMDDCIKNYALQIGKVVISVVPFDDIIDWASNKLCDKSQVFKSVMGYINDVVDNVKFKLDGIFGGLYTANTVYGSLFESESKEEKVVDDDFNGFNIGAEGNADNIPTKTDVPETPLLDKICGFLKEMLTGELVDEFESRMADEEEELEAREQGEEYSGNGVTYGGVVKYNDTWTHTVPELATSASYFDIYLELCDSEGNPVAYDADDIDITCTGVIGGRRIDLLNPESVNG